MNVTLRELRALREVAETRNFTAAAERLHTTQSALSSNIRELERKLDIKLIDRTTRRFALTDAGTEFLPAVTRILVDLERSIGNLTTLATLKRGIVTVGCPPAIASALLASPISGFRQRYPQVSVVLKDGASGQTIARLRSGEVEIAIGTLRQPEPDLAAVPFISDKLIALALAKSPLGRKKSIPWRVLGSHPVIAPSRESSTRDIIERTYVKATGRNFEPAFEAAYWMTVASMVEAGLGVAVMPSHAAKYLPGTLRAIQLTQPVVSRDISVITHKERMLSPAASQFVQFLLAPAGGGP